MLTREAIEQVLKKHKSDYARVYSDTGLIDDLLALQPPEPSREALEKIIQKRKWIGISVVREAGIESTSFITALLDDLMTWATGPGEPKWCEHMDGLDHLTFDYGWHSYPTMAKEMMVCPRCGTKRPEGR